MQQQVPRYAGGTFDGGGVGSLPPGVEPVLPAPVVPARPGSRLLDWLRWLRPVPGGRRTVWAGWPWQPPVQSLPMPGLPAVPPSNTPLPVLPPGTLQGGHPWPWPFPRFADGTEEPPPVETPLPPSLWQTFLQNWRQARGYQPSSWFQQAWPWTGGDGEEGGSGWWGGGGGGGWWGGAWPWPQPPPPPPPPPVEPPPPSQGGMPLAGATSTSPWHVNFWNLSSQLQDDVYANLGRQTNTSPDAWRELANRYRIFGTGSNWRQGY